MALLAASAATMAAATAAQAGGAPETVAAGHPRVTNPYAPSYRHLYRGGAVPTRGAAARMAGWARQHSGAATASPAAASGAGAASANNVRYGGGNDGIGVTTGDERVYLVFFGSQWGTQGTNGNGDITLSGDPSGEAPYLQEMFKGLGTGNEQWSGVMTQYCEGVSRGRPDLPGARPARRLPARRGAGGGVGGRERRLTRPGNRRPARAGGGRRRHPLRQHHGRQQPGRLLRHPLPDRHGPRPVPGAGILRLARLERRPHAQPRRRRPLPRR